VSQSTAGTPYSQQDVNIIIQDISKQLSDNDYDDTDNNNTNTVFVLTYSF